MLDQANRLRQVILTMFFFLLVFIFIFIKYKPIGLFLSTADEIFGPITTLRRDNRVVKHVPWSAFKLGDSDWERVVDVRDILNVCDFFCSLFEIIFTHIYRTLIKFSNTFLPKKNPLFGVFFPPLKICNRNGRRNATHLDLISIKMLSQTALKSWRNIIFGSTRSLVSS